MEAIIKKTCENCSQLYLLKSLTKEKHGNLPLLLSCGHSMCENCVRNTVNFAEPVECKVCKKDTDISTASLTSLTQNKISLYELFPVNVYLLGELALQAIQHQYGKEDKQDKDFYLDIKAIAEVTPKTEGTCLECHSPTSKMCQQCGIIVCVNCFNKSHKNFIIFKNHVLHNIEIGIEQPMCSAHKGKPLEYYCKDCRKSTCMDCLMVGGEKSCKNHNVVSAQEVNKDILSDIIEITPKVEEKLRRLTKTAVDIGNLLSNIEHETSSSVILTLVNNIEQHFSRLTFLIQKQKQTVTEKLIKLKSDQLTSLTESKSVIADNIKRAKSVIDKLNSLDDEKKAQMNLAVLLEEARAAAGLPWHLWRDAAADALVRISIDDKVFESIENFIKFEENGASAYELLTTEGLVQRQLEVPPPPQNVVYPPKIVDDVRKRKKNAEAVKSKKPILIKMVPTYTSKHGSSTSLNSSNSSSSQNSSRTTYKKLSSYLENQKTEPMTSYQSIHPRPLLQGDQDLVYITHIVDPHNLFVQRACHQPVVEELLREFRNASSMPKPSSSHIAEGKTYLVYIKADNLWQRSVVTSINRKDVNKPAFTLFCVDFGSTETVNIDKMRLIPSARIHNPPPLAINCSLDGCRPVGGAWTGDDALLVQNIIDNQPAVLQVRAEGGARVSVELTTYEHGVSVAHALAFHGRARLLPRTPYPKILELKEKPKIYSSNNDYIPNSKQDVHITHIVSPDMFYVRKAHLQKVYEKLCDDLDAEYDNNDPTGSIYLPEIDMVCAANVERCADVGGGASTRGVVWARARVDQLPGRGRVRVQLLDSGEMPFLHWGALRRLPQKFCNQNALAAQCHLAGVTPLNKKWSPASVELLRAFTGRALQLVVEGERTRGSVGVTLYDEQLDGDEPVCVNTLMIRRKFAVTFGLFMFNKNPDIQNLVRTNKSPLEDLKPRKYKKKVEILNKDQRNEPVNKSTDLEAKDKGPIRLEVRILNHQSPSLIYISMVHQEHIFKGLYEKIQTYYTENATGGREGWSVGDRCCTICRQSQTWRRAAVLELDAENATVFYSDFAIIETVPISSLRDMPVDMPNVGDAAVLCHLYGVVPAVGNDWPSLTKEYLRELLDAYQRVFITKLGMFKGKSMPIELWVYHTIQGGALEPNVSEWRCLNNKIIEQGLGIPDKTREAVEPAAGEDTLSFLNLTGPITDWLQTEPMPLKPFKMESKTQSPSSTPTEPDEDKSEDYLQDPNTIFISDWKSADPLPDKEFTAIPTYIDNNGVIYLHDVAQRETLDMIRKALDVRFKIPDPKAKFTRWVVGEPCVALYFLDNKFYRGRVIEVNPEASTCLIHYIDYGNEEICSFVNLRKSIVLYQIPIQAHKCVLDRIGPADRYWDRTTLDYIHKSIVEKECQVKVSREAVNEFIPIDLTYNKLSINDHLVEFEMAKYTDGTKVKIQKFVPNTRKLKEHADNVIESDSSADYIVDDCDYDVIKKRDWNDILYEEEQTLSVNFITYSNFKATVFSCNVIAIQGADNLELCVVLDDERQGDYNRMFTKLQQDIDNLAPLDGVFENKACVALFPDDGSWYRATILQYSEAKAKVKVKYVDYGNICVVALTDIREITPEYVEIPPAIVTATLHNVQTNPAVSLQTLHEFYKKTLLVQGPFKAKVIEYNDGLPCVQIMDDNGKSPYEDLYEEIFSRRN